MKPGTALWGTAFQRRAPTFRARDGYLGWMVGDGPKVGSSTAVSGGRPTSSGGSWAVAMCRGPSARVRAPTGWPGSSARGPSALVQPAFFAAVPGQRIKGGHIASQPYRHRISRRCAQRPRREHGDQPQCATVRGVRECALATRGSSRVSRAPTSMRADRKPYISQTPCDGPGNQPVNSLTSPAAPRKVQRLRRSTRARPPIGRRLLGLQRWTRLRAPGGPRGKGATSCYAGLNALAAAPR